MSVRRESAACLENLPNSAIDRFLAPASQISAVSAVGVFSRPGRMIICGISLFLILCHRSFFEGSFRHAGPCHLSYSNYRTSLMFAVLAAGWLLSSAQPSPPTASTGGLSAGGTGTRRSKASSAGRAGIFPRAARLKQSTCSRAMILPSMPDVSEQQVCWETNPDMGSTGGGWGPSVLSYFTSHGVVSETECPYQSSSPDTGIAPYWPLASGWAKPRLEKRFQSERFHERHQHDEGLPEDHKVHWRSASGLPTICTLPWRTW